MADENEELEFRLRSERESASAKPRAATTPPASYATNLAAAPEAALSLGTGALAAPLAGLAGLGQGALNLGRSAVNAVAPGTLGPGMPAGDRVRQVQEGLTYRPRTELGQTVTGAIAYPFEKIAQGADYVGGNVAEATGSPAIGAGVNTALQSVPAMVARGVKAPASRALARAETEAADLKSVNSVKDTTVNRARDLGYVFPPSEVQGSFLGNQLESVGGKAAIGQEVNRRNQQVTNAVGRREAGLAENEPLSVNTLTAARSRMAGPYREVTALSPAAAEALERVQTLRQDAKDLWSDYGVNRRVETKKAAQKADSDAQHQELIIDAEAHNLGVPGLVTRLRQARQALAKNFDVEAALNVGSGDLNAAIWGRMLDRGRPLSGDLETAARAAEAMGRYTKDVSAVPSPGVSKLKPVAAAGLGLAGYGTMGPLGALAGLAPFLDGPARSLALSRGMQTPRSYGPGAGVSGLELLTRNPEAYGTIPALGAGDDQGLARLLRR